MYNGPWWDMFAYYGTVELYLLYKTMQRQARENERIENNGADIDISQFK